MKEKFHKFRASWTYYIFQSIIATFSIFVVLLILRFSNAIVIASIGATVFIIFGMPNSVSARPRNVIGGHLTGLIFGSIFSFIPYSSHYEEMFLLALAVGFSMFVMVVMDTEHPPACGTALGIALLGFSWKVVITLLGSVILLSVIHVVFKKHIRDLI